MIAETLKDILLSLIDSRVGRPILMKTLRHISFSIAGLSLIALSHLAIASPSNASSATLPTHKSKHSLFISAAFGAEYSRFQNSDFMGVIENVRTGDLPFNTVSQSNSFDEYVGRFSVGYNFLSFMGAELGMFTNFNNNYKATYTGAVSGTTFTDNYHYHFNVYDMLLDFHYQLNSVPLIFSFNPGVALVNLKVNLDETDNIPSSRSSQNKFKFVRPAFNLGISYDFIRNQNYSNIIGLSWYHIAGNNATHTTQITGNGSTTIDDLVKSPTINLWLLTYTLQFNV